MELFFVLLPARIEATEWWDRQLLFVLSFLKNVCTIVGGGCGCVYANSHTVHTWWSVDVRCFDLVTFYLIALRWGLSWIQELIQQPANSSDPSKPGPTVLWLQARTAIADFIYGHQILEYRSYFLHSKYSYPLNHLPRHALIYSAEKLYRELLSQDFKCSHTQVPKNNNSETSYMNKWLGQ